MYGGGHVWWGSCVVGGHVWQGGMHGRGHVWQGSVHGGGMRGEGGMCGKGGMCGEGGGTWQERWPLQRTIRILLECILVLKEITRSVKLRCNGKKSCLLAKVHSRLQISKQFFQVEYSIIGQILKSKLYLFWW